MASNFFGGKKFTCTQLAINNGNNGRYVKGKIKMEEKMKCPVCNKFNILSTYSGPYGLEESHYNCSRCGYLDEFAYGYTRNIVKGVCLCSSWRDNYTQEKLYIRRYTKLLYEAKRNWKKRHKVYTKLNTKHRLNKVRGYYG